MLKTDNVKNLQKLEFELDFNGLWWGFCRADELIVVAQQILKKSCRVLVARGKMNNNDEDDLNEKWARTGQTCAIQILHIIVKR